MSFGKKGRSFYSIGEVSELLGIREHVLRFWEKEFKELSPSKSAKRRREYRNKDIIIIEKIRELLYDKGFTVAGAKKQLGKITIDYPKEEFLYPVHKSITKKTKGQALKRQSKENHSLLDTKSNVDFLTKTKKAEIIKELKVILNLLDTK